MKGNELPDVPINFFCGHLSPCNGLIWDKFPSCSLLSLTSISIRDEWRHISPRHSSNLALIIVYNSAEGMVFPSSQSTHMEVNFRIIALIREKSTTLLKEVNKLSLQFSSKAAYTAKSLRIKYDY